MTSGDSSSVVQSQLDTVQARNDTSSITDEQTCALLQQKHMSLSEEFSKLELKQAQNQNSVDRCVQELELAQVQAKMHQIHLQSDLLQKHMSLSEDLSKLEFSEESKHNSVDQELVQVQADSSVAARAATIGDLHNNTSSITDEQTCALLEKKYTSLFEDFSKLESKHAQLQNSVDRCMQELAQVQAEKNRIQLQSMEKDGEIEKTSTEVSELHKLRRQLTVIVSPDLYRPFLMYRNGSFGQEVNYGEYLQGFSAHLNNIRRQRKRTRSYRVYLETLLETLEKAYMRTELQLPNIDLVYLEVKSDFLNDWELGTLLGWESNTRRDACMHREWAEHQVESLKADGNPAAEMIIMSLLEETRPRLVALSSALKIKAGGTDHEIRERLIEKLTRGSTNSKGKALEKKTRDKMIEAALLECQIKKLCVLLKV